MTPRDACRLIDFERRNQMRLARRAVAHDAPDLLIGFCQGVAAGLSAAAVHIQEIDDFDDDIDEDFE